MAGSNSVKVSSKFETQTPPEGETVKVEVDTVTIQKEDDTASIQENDLEKLEKLASFRNQGLLTEEEYNQAKEQIMNKKS